MIRLINLNEWETQWRETILTGNKEINTANVLRNYIEKSLKRAIDDLNKQKKSTNEALTRRIEQTSEAKIKLENEHSEVSIIVKFYFFVISDFFT